jgi:hypothetical protein
MLMSEQSKEAAPRFLQSVIRTIHGRIFSIDQERPHRRD